MGDPIVSYWAGPMPITERDVLQMKEGGWNLVWVTPRGINENETLANHYLRQLDILEKHNMRGIVSLGKVIQRDRTKPSILDNKDKRKKLTNTIHALKNHRALFAYHLIDEPNVNIFGNLKKLKEYILTIDPTHLLYVNLYPIYAKGSQLGIQKTNKVEAYREYLKEFIDTYQPQLISYDHYPLSTKGEKKSYFQNLVEISSASKKAQLPFMVILQASSWSTGKRIPTGEELSWQMFTSLAYGAQGISWYVYGYPGHDGSMIYPTKSNKNNRVVLGGKPTSLYHYAKIVNKEFFKIATELKKEAPKGAYHIGMIPRGTIKLPSNSPFKITPTVEEKTLDQPVEGFVVGLYGNTTKASHALVVNLDYRTYSGRKHKRREEFLNPIQRYISSIECLSLFDSEKSEWISTNSKKVPLNISPGSGLLVKQSPCVEKHN